ncbi:MAG: hypothetical protein ABSC05_28025 [Candidatus Solibacter sp.]
MRRYETRRSANYSDASSSKRRSTIRIRDWLAGSGSRYPGNASRNLGVASRPFISAAHICSDIGGALLHFHNEYGTAINYGNQILQVVASLKVSLPATFERFELRGDEERTRDHADFEIIREPFRNRRLHCSPIPAVGKPENPLIQRHHVENGPVMDPPAQRRSFSVVFQEPQRTQSIAKGCVCCIGRDFGDRIHIERRSRIGRGLVGNEETRDASSHKYEFFKQRAQKTGSRN